LWVIVGGTLAIDFEEFGYTMRFNNAERWIPGPNWGWKTGPNFPIVEDLTHGADDVQAFLREQLSAKILREERIANLPYKTYKSKRFHDTDNATYVYIEHAPFMKGYVTPLIAASRWYCGRGTDEIRRFGSEVHLLMEEFYLAIEAKYGHCPLERINPDEYDEYVRLMLLLHNPNN